MFSNSLSPLTDQVPEMLSVLLSKIWRAPGQTADQVMDPLVRQAVNPSYLPAQKGFKRLPNEIRASDLTFAGRPVELLEQRLLKPDRNL